MLMSRHRPLKVPEQPRTSCPVDATSDEVVKFELERLATYIKEGQVTGGDIGEKVSKAAQLSRIYYMNPAAVLDYTGNIPDEWREWRVLGRSDIQAMAYCSFEDELLKEFNDQLFVE